MKSRENQTNQPQAQCDLHNLANILTHRNQREREREREMFYLYHNATIERERERERETF